VSAASPYLARFSLEGRVALVTGARRGLGFEIARALAGSGAHVVIAGRDDASLAGTEAAIAAEGLSCSRLAFDLLDFPAVKDAVARIAAEHGRLDILVNAAADRNRKRLADFSDEEIVHLVAADLTAAIVLCREAAKPMVAAGWGRLINVTSIAGQVARAGDTVYTAAKHGLTGFVRGLAAEYGPHRVTSNAIAPGGFATKANAAAKADPVVGAHFARRTALGRWGEPDEIAGAAVFLASEAASYVTGHVLFVDGGHTATM
jgi:gluconate 5-dehydrogenase